MFFIKGSNFSNCTGSCKFSQSNQNFITGDKVKLLSESIETNDSKAMVVLLCKLIISSWLFINVL